MPLPNNSTLQGGKYRIVRFISSGGFGCTYEAEHVMLRSRVAIKEFFVKDFCNRDANTAQVSVGTTSKLDLVEKLRKKFIDEARGLCNLHHEGVVRVQDVFEENGTAYFVMDFVNGRSLSDLLKRRGSLPPAEAVGYIRQVAKALAYVHSKNRLHLDIKPGNIMIDEGGRAVLIDFGASKQYDEASGENTSTLIGRTPGFAPPEQMSNNVVHFSAATDIYALGATLYALICGETPPDTNLLNSGDAVVRPLPEIVSPAIRQAIESAMQLRRTERPQTMNEFLRLLEGENAPDDSTDMNENLIKAKPAPRPAPAPQSTSKKGREEDRKKGFKMILIPFVTIILAAGAIFFGMRGCGGHTTDEESYGTLDVDTVAADTVPNLEEVTNVDIQLDDGYKTKFKYTGTVDADGKATGKGIGIYENGTYEGEYTKNLRDGEGTFRLHDGSNTFKGKFRRDYYDSGRLTLSDGTYYTGSFNDGQPYNGVWYKKDGSLISYVKNGE